MTVRRIEAAQVKPGRHQDYFQLVRNFAEAVEPHGVSPITLVRNSSGGPATGTFSAFADWDSMEAYGTFIDASVQDEAVQEAYGAFFAEDSPVTMGAANLLIRLAAFGADEPVGQPGVAASVRVWSTPPGQQSVIVEAFGKIAELYSHTNAHFSVGEIYAGGPDSGKVMTAAVFPNLAELGAYVDDMRQNPRVAEMIRDYAGNNPLIRVQRSSIVRAVAY